MKLLRWERIWNFLTRLRHRCPVSGMLCSIYQGKCCCWIFCMPLKLLSVPPQKRNAIMNFLMPPALRRCWGPSSCDSLIKYFGIWCPLPHPFRFSVKSSLRKKPHMKKRSLMEWNYNQLLNQLSWEIPIPSSIHPEPNLLWEAIIIWM